MKTFRQHIIESVPTDKDGNELVDMNGKPLTTNSDGTLTLHHRTNKDNAARVTKSGRFTSKENTDETYFSSHPTGHGEGYGDTVVKVRVHPRHTRINDAFHNGEVHVAVSNKHLSRRNIVK